MWFLKMNMSTCTNGCERHCRYADWGLLFIRVAAGLIFLVHGYGKLFGNMPGMDGFTHMVAGLGFPIPAFFAWVIAIAEFFGGIALILGFLMRYFAPILLVDMFVAFTMVFKADILHGGQEFMLFWTVLALMCAGPGRFALGMRRRSDGSKDA